MVAELGRHAGQELIKISVVGCIRARRTQTTLAFVFFGFLKKSFYIDAKQILKIRVHLATLIFKSFGTPGMPMGR